MENSNFLSLQLLIEKYNKRATYWTIKKKKNRNVAKLVRFGGIKFEIFVKFKRMEILME